MPPRSACFLRSVRPREGVGESAASKCLQLESATRSARQLICSGRSQHLGCSEVGDRASGITRDSMNRKTVSVIIPYYRASQTIARAVESALGQTVRPYEILVVDDGSPDDARIATKEFGSSVTLFHKPNGGAASARNLGIEQAQGEWIAFLDAEDYWEPGKLEPPLASSE